MQPGQNTKVVTMLNPVAVSATTRTLIVDTANASGAEIFLYVGAAGHTPSGTDKFTATLQSGSGITAAGQADIVAATDDIPSRMCKMQDGTLWPSSIVLDEAGDFGKLYRFPIRPDAGKRYVSLNIVEAGTASAPMAAWAVLAAANVPVEAPVVGTTAT